MKLKLILPAASAAALAAAAIPAAAQMYPDQQGEMVNRQSPASGIHSSTGVPSVDSTRPTGARQGYTTMPDGKITGDTQDAVNPPNMSARTGMSSNTAMSGRTMSSDARMKGETGGYEAQSATQAGAMASNTGAIINYELVTNGPIPDTPENREQFGGPISQAGKATAPRGN